jgi:hypothetical protein
MAIIVSHYYVKLYIERNNKSIYSGYWNLNLKNKVLVIQFSQGK